MEKQRNEKWKEGTVPTDYAMLFPVAAVETERRPGNLPRMLRSLWAARQRSAFCCRERP